MAIQNDNKNKPSVEALISNAVDFVDETVGAVAERIDVLPKLDGETLASAKEDFQRLLGKLKDVRLSIFSPSEAFTKNDDPVVELHDEGITRLLADVAHMFMGLSDEVHDLLSHDNGRPVGHD